MIQWLMRLFSPWCLFKLLCVVSTRQRRRRWTCRRLWRAFRPNRERFWSPSTTGRSNMSRTAKTSMWRFLSWPRWHQRVSESCFGCKIAYFLNLLLMVLLILYFTGSLVFVTYYEFIYERPKWSIYKNRFQKSSSHLTFLCCSVIFLTQTEVNSYRLELEGITVKGKGCPKPIKTWVQCGVSMKILSSLKKWAFVNNYFKGKLLPL